MQGTSLGALGEYALDEGRPGEALPLLERSSRIYLDLGERPELMVNLWRLARALVLDGRAADAARVFAAGEALREDMGSGSYSWMESRNEETLAAVREQLEEDAYAEAWEQGRRLTVEKALALALEDSPSPGR
jgi:hypothetical protein